MILIIATIYKEPTRCQAWNSMLDVSEWPNLVSIIFFFSYIRKMESIVMEITLSQVASKQGIGDLNLSLFTSKVHTISTHLRLFPWASLSLLLSPLFIIYWFYPKRKTLSPRYYFTARVCSSVFKMEQKYSKEQRPSLRFFSLSNWI